MYDGTNFSMHKHSSEYIFNKIVPNLIRYFDLKYEILLNVETFTV